MVRFFKWLAGASSVFDRVVIDAIVNAVGRFGRWLATTLRRFVDELFIDNAVNGTGFVAQVAGSVLRLIQTGQVQLYLLVMLLAVLILLATTQLIF